MRRPARVCDRRWLIVGLVLVLAFVGLVVVPAAGALYAGHQLVTNLDRTDGVFDGLSDRDRPAVGSAGATNILVVVTDRGADPAAARAARTAMAQEVGRSDSFMILHLDADRRAASIISIPPNRVIEVSGHGTGLSSTALPLRGGSFAVRTVEDLTGVRVNHLAVIDWSRIGALVDSVGGIDVVVTDAVQDRATGVTWTKGRHHVDGLTAVSFVRQDGLPRADLDQIARQHVVLRAVMADALEQKMRKDPLRLYRFLDQVTRGLAVDRSWSVSDMARLAFSMGDFRSAKISYLTAPVGAVTHLAGGEVLHPAAQSHGLWRAVAEDRVSEWEAQHPDATTPWSDS